ncbi:MAG: secretin N-terminal domain-containing protein [Candidatus Zixiibacteriota bacterium]
MNSLKFSKCPWVVLILIIAAGLVGSAAAQTEDPGAPIENLSFQAAEIRSVIRFLADYGQVNVVVAPDVQGSVTINLRNVYWKQALEIIGRTYNLAVVWEDAGYIRILQADKFRQEQSEINKHNFEQETLAKLEVKIVRLANTAAADIKESVKSLLSERGKVDSDEHTNSLIIQEIPENLQSVVNFIKELDKPARQIRISAQLLEIYSNDDFELGVSWDAAGTYQPNADRSITQTGSQDGSGRVTDPFITYSVGFLQRGWSVDAIVSAVISEGKGKIIAHPEITTIENKEARIQMGQKVPVKQFDEAGNVVIKFEEIGTILKVTPHITADNQILMHLMPERSTLEPDATSGIIINTNNAETNVVVNNGQTAVIGGLTTQDEVEAVSGIPILKDIPVLGMVFRYTTKTTENRDLVIFVTPTIVENDLAGVETTP